MLEVMAKLAASQEKQIREHWFPRHVGTWREYGQVYSVEHPAVASIQVLEWRDPKSWTYGVVYMIRGQTLIVIGDVEDAIYQWHGAENMTFKWIAECDFEYVRGKCLACPNGLPYVQWDGAVALARLEDFFHDDPERIAKFNDEFGAADCLSDKGEWHQWLAADGFNILGESYGEMFGAGEVPSIHARGHHVGLQMAVAQLAAAQLVARTEATPDIVDDRGRPARP